MNTLISISPSEFDGFSKVQGNLILEGKLNCFLNKNPTFKFSVFQGWHPVCDKNDPLPDHFEFAFNVPNKNVSQTEVCAIITGPEKFLPYFLEPNCNVTTVTSNKVCQDIILINLI